MNNKIDLNRADEATLAVLPGIGEKLAQRIVTYRETVHPFEETIELAAVPGISERMVREIEARVFVAPDGGASRPEAAAPVAVTPHVVVAPPDHELDAQDKTEDSVVMTPGAAETEAKTTSETALPVLVSRDTQEAAPIARPRLLRDAMVALAGALAGVALTVAMLYLLNGTLRFTGNARGARLQQALNAQESEQERLLQALDAAATRAATAAVQQATLAAALAAAEEELRRVDEEVVPAVSTLEAQAAALEENVGAIATSAADFESFLDGLRDLLLTLQGTPASTPAPGSTATTQPTTTGTSAITPTGEASTAAATRTPRPTATPLN